jgi:hypothetical protein
MVTDPNVTVRGGGGVGLRDKLKWIMLIYESGQSLKKSFDALPLNRDTMSLLVHIFPSQRIPLCVFSIYLSLRAANNGLSITDALRLHGRDSSFLHTHK